MNNKTYSLKFDTYLRNFKIDNLQGANFLGSSLLFYVKEELELHSKSKRSGVLQQILLDLKGVHPELIEIQKILDLLRNKPSLNTVIKLINQFKDVKNQISTRTAEWLWKNHCSAVLTLSNSSFVYNSLIKWANDDNDLNNKKDVHILESRPMKEGKLLLTELNSQMKNTIFYFWVDSAINYAIKKSDVLILGCDKIYSDYSIMNKIGSFPAALLAQYYNKPVIVCGSTFKLEDKSSYNDTTDSQQTHAETEIIPDLGSFNNLNIQNWYFEVVPNSLISEIILENRSISLNK